MNKLLTLINVDLKRSSRFYLKFISFFFLGTLTINILQILNYKDLKYIIEVAIKNFNGIFYGNSILNRNYVFYTAILIGIGLLIVYSFYSWTREYMQNNKSFYTLFMIPCNRYIIYLAKVISSITMVYGFLISQIVVMIISKNIFNIVLNKYPIIKTSLAVDILFSYDSMILGPTISRVIPTTFVDFIMTYGFLLLMIISVVFTGILIALSYNDSMFKLGISLILYGTVVYIMISKQFGHVIYAYISSNIGVIGFYILFYVIAIVAFNLISYYLINKKLFI